MRWLSSVCWAALVACGTEPTPTPEPVVVPEPPAPSWPEVVADDLLVDVLEHNTMSLLDQPGRLRFDTVLGQPVDGPMTLANLGSSARFSALVDAWSPAIERTGTQLQRDLVVEHADAVNWPAGNVGRRFDVRWLRSDKAVLQLVGVVNRLDRRDFIGGCGEVRLMYRLGYRDARPDGIVATSSLPFVVNAVLHPTETDCRAWAHAWTGAPSDPHARATWLANGVLAADSLTLHQLELNVQTVRLPSGVATRFGGQAEYLQRVDRFVADEVISVPLENTPDVAKLREDDALRTALIAWIDANHDAIDSGVYTVPERFLATESLSWSTLGSHRPANKPFQSLLDVDSLAKPDDGQWVRDRAALLDRLDNGTCMGCHQAASTAGFHFLGHDDPDMNGITNRRVFAASPHARAERTRRHDLVLAVANGADVDRFRPHSLASVASGAPGMTCVLPEHADAVATPWGCDAPATCEPVVQTDGVAMGWGTCIVPEADLTSGLPCHTGTIRAASYADGLPFNARADRDQFTPEPRYELPSNKSFHVDSYNCRPPVIGVPLGRAFRRCSSDERALTALASGEVSSEICAIVGGSKFDSCVEGDFHTCLDGIVGRGMVDSCHPGKACREDYICQRLPWQLEGVPADAGRAVDEAGIGFCTPNYFVFQLRLDGHPVPI